MAVHQYARFCNDSKLAHERAVMKIGKYLLSTKDRGIKFTPDLSKEIECYADVNFAGAWDKADAKTLRMFCPILDSSVSTVGVLCTGAQKYNKKLHYRQS